MNINFWQRFRKIETILLGVLLYCIVLVYTYHYLQIANKCGFLSADEIFYYIEAKAVSVHNIYQTPLSLDGNTSLIGDFGFHGIAYAIKDGWLSKVFFHAQDPPLVFINFLTCLATLALILLFKPFSFNTRLKIALVVATHYILYSFTLSSMQETIQFFFAVLALRTLYLLYQSPSPLSAGREGSGGLGRVTYLIIIIIAITFRFSWFMWGLGLLPLATNFKTFVKWLLITICLTAFGILLVRYIHAAYPYSDAALNRLLNTENLSPIDSIAIVWQNFMQNIRWFLIPNGEKLITTCMRYLFLSLLLINSWFAVKKRNRFTIACTLIALAYFVSCCAFNSVVGTGENDERGLAILNPLLAFSLIGNCNSIIFYPIIVIQLLLFPNVVAKKNSYYMSVIPFITSPTERISRAASYSKISDLITDEENVVILLPKQFVLNGNPNYIFDFPLITGKGYPIHYRIFIDGNDLRKTHPAKYLLSDQERNDSNYKLIYGDRYIHLYRILN